MCLSGTGWYYNSLTFFSILSGGLEPAWGTEGSAGLLPAKLTTVITIQMDVGSKAFNR